MREGVRGVDPHLPIAAVRTQEEQINASLQSVRLMATLASVLGGLAVLLAGIGLYGILAYSVSRRTPRSAFAWRSAPSSGRCGGW